MSLIFKYLVYAVLGTAIALSHQVPAREEAVAAAVRADELRRYVRELVALGPRMGGTPSNAKSAAYVASHFTKLGLAVRVEDDAPQLAHWEDSWRVAFEDGSAIESAHPLGFSPSAAAGTRGALLHVPDLRRASPDPSWAGRVIYTEGDVRGAYG